MPQGADIARGAARGTRRYALIESLGVGEFGEVFVARDRAHGGIVALKVLRRTDAEWLYRFKREFRQVADVAHPNLVRLYELFEEDGDYYLTMELVDGIPFDEHLARAPEQLESCFSQLAAGIRALHQTGALHRDIKPMNALVEATGRVVLLDFGLAYGLESPDSTSVAGTPHYMAPEQWVNQLSEATDWYAFGIMLYEALAGRPAFEGSGMALMKAKQRGPEPIEPIDGDDRLTSLAARLLAGDPAARPTGDEVIDTFRSSRVTERRRGERLPFVGRDAELAAMRDATAGTGAALVTVVGEPGIGKTALAKAFVDAARRDGAAVYEGRCHETESVPFKGLDGAIDMMCNDLRRRPRDELQHLLPQRDYCMVEMFPVLKRVGALAHAHSLDAEIPNPHARRSAAVSELRALLDSLAATQRVILFLDDLQWAGDDTLRLLLELIEAPPPPVVVVATARAGSDPVRQFAERAGKIAEMRVSTIELAPLDREGVKALVEQHSGSFDTDAAWRESGGHPYLLSRMLSRGTEGGLTASLDASIDSLGAPARAVLDVVALAAQPLTQGAAFEAAGLDGWRADVVDELRRQRLVRTAGARPVSPIEPYHDRVRETVLGALDPDELRSRHAALATYLELHRRASAHALAHHYQEAGRRSDAQRWVLLAARDAARGLAFDRADELYRQAVELTEPAQAGEVRREWGTAMVLAGRRERAAAIYLDAAAAAAELGRDDEVAQLRSLSGVEWIMAGHFPRGIELIEIALRDAGVDMPPDTVTAAAGAFNLGGELSVRGLDFVERDAADIDPDALRRLDLELTIARALALTDMRCQYIATRALVDALALGEIRRVQVALCHFVIGSCARAPDHELFVDAVARAYALAERMDSDTARAWAVAADAVRLHLGGSHGEAWPLLAAAERRFWSLDPPMVREASGMRILRVACAAVEGVDLQFAIRVVDEWLREGESRQDLFVGNWLRLVGARVKAIQGDVEGAIRQKAEAREIWSYLDDDLFVAMCCHMDMIHAVLMDPATAHARGRELDAELGKLFASAAPVGRSAFYVFYGSAIAAGAAAGSISADELIERLDYVIDELSQQRYSAAAIPGMRAHQALARGDRAAAAELMLETARGWDETRQLLYSLSARLRHAQLCRDRPRAEALIDQLRDLGVGDPEGYATVLAGPAPPP